MFTDSIVIGTKIESLQWLSWPSLYLSWNVHYFSEHGQHSGATSGYSDHLSPATVTLW